MGGIYLHIPFCRQACHYCNFHFTTSLRKKGEVVNAMQQEITWAAAQQQFPVETVYFGGGTPSLLTSEELASLLETVHNHFDVLPNAEITLETNPDDINKVSLNDWYRCGINRLSIGIQSFFEEDLQWMHRAHNAAQAAEALALAKAAFDNITIDLIYGVPGQSAAKWQQNVDKAVAMNIPHLSCYALTVEPQTPLHKLIRLQQKNDTDAAQQSEHFTLLMQWMREAGYEHYEISNFAKPGYRSRHNSSYWQGKPYIGIGPGAHSYNGNVRRWNLSNNQKYIAAIAQHTPHYEQEVLTKEQIKNEYIMTSLRTIEGLDLRFFDEKDAAQILRHAQKRIGLCQLVAENHFLKLTQQGKFFADGITVDLMFG
ncbi:MAG: radical SAM family heme chaperone HemW [Niabella sp.]